MIELVAVVIGVALGFIGSRQLRRAGGRNAPAPQSPLRKQRQRTSPELRRPMPATDRPRSAQPQPPFPLAATPPVTVPRPTAPLALAVVRRDTGERLALGSGPISVGRSSERDLTIDDDRVSRAHAHLERRSSGWFVIDDGSANGTTVNRSKIPAGQPRAIVAGDRIGIGPFDLEVVADGPAEPGGRTAVHGS